MTTETTGLEHETPVRIKSTSATERGGFRKCRRQWFLTTVHRLDSQEGNINFFLGTIYHAGLEAYYRAQMRGANVDDREVAAIDAYQSAYDAYMVRLEDQLGALWQFAETNFTEAGKLGLEMLQNYFERELADPLLDEVLAVEFRVNVPIVNAKGGKVGILSVQADAVGVKDDQLAVCDHKTASQAMQSAHLDIDDQLTAECYSWWKAKGTMPDKAIYNVSIKKAPQPPKQLKSAKLSQAKNQLTTERMYRDEIARLGHSVADYVDILAILHEREESGEDRLFQREATFRTPEQMAAFERDLFEEWRDMRAVASHPERAYPSPTSMNCGSCPVRIICTTIQDDGDVEAIIKAGYVVAEPRR